MGKLTSKDTKIISIALAAWGILFISSGYTMNVMTQPQTVITKELEITQKRVAQRKTSEIKLQEMISTIDEPLSLNVRDYLINVETIDSETIKSLKLDTSTVNITEAGTYKYTITFNKKKYVGTYTINAKELPKVDLILKNFKLATNSSLSTDLSTYIEGTLTEEVKNNIILDLSSISTTEPGLYQYSVTYNNRLYTGTIEVYEPQTKVITPNQEQKETEENSNDTQKEVEEEKTNEETEINNEQ